MSASWLDGLILRPIEFRDQLALTETENRFIWALPLATLTETTASGSMSATSSIELFLIDVGVKTGQQVRDYLVNSVCDAKHIARSFGAPELDRVNVAVSHLVASVSQVLESYAM